jgi:hypothetical protein
LEIKWFVWAFGTTVIKKYGECLNKKIITVKDTLPLIPLASNTLIPSFLPFSEAVLKVLFCECL